MRDQVIGGLLGAARTALVLAALLVALVPIGRAAVSGFCPEGSGGDAGPDDVVAAAPVAGLLGTTVEPSGDASDEPLPDPNAPPSESGSEPADPSGSDAVVEQTSPCGAGVDRCFPPLISAVLRFGDGTCGEEARSRLRSSMLPAFGVATVLLVGAWALRPRDGAPVISRH